MKGISILDLQISHFTSSSLGLGKSHKPSLIINLGFWNGIGDKLEKAIFLATKIKILNKRSQNNDTQKVYRNL